MIPQNLKIIQLTQDGKHIGLYLTTRDDIENFQGCFDTIFRMTDGVQDEADKILSEDFDIHREFAEEVILNL